MVSSYKMQRQHVRRKKMLMTSTQLDVFHSIWKLNFTLKNMHKACGKKHSLIERGWGLGEGGAEVGFEYNGTECQEKGPK